MIGRRAQGAMEYLMTYGWAILVVMIVGIVMWQLGIFNMGGTTVTATGFAKIKPQLAGTGITRLGIPRMVFTNGVGTTITVVSARVVDVGTPTKSCGITSLQFSPSKTVNAGDNFKVTSAYAVSCIVPTVNAGTVYNARVSLNYVVNIGGISTNHAETGTIRGPSE
jgi:hypothetical protein